MKDENSLANGSVKASNENREENRKKDSEDQLKSSLILHHSSYVSRSFGRPQPYAFLAPPDYESAKTPDHSEKRYPLLILLHGLTGNHLTWSAQTRLAQYAGSHEFVIAFPEGGEGWYTNAFDGANNYEDDLVQDFIPHLQRTLPLLPSGRHWAIGGMSMGGYGAVKIALQHGRMFSLAVSHSGAFEFNLRKESHVVFGDPENDLGIRRATNVFKLAEDALSTWPPARPNLYFDCGVGDRWLEANRHFHQHLDYIGYRHTYVEQPGYHTLPYWDRAIRQALPTIADAIGAGTRDR